MIATKDLTQDPSAALYWRLWSYRARRAQRRSGPEEQRIMYSLFAHVHGVTHEAGEGRG
jgi:hypothetical protein